MTLSREVRRLERAWQNGTAWPKRLDWVEITNLRGWDGQRIKFPFPIVAISGENGSGKSTIIQACAAVYQKQHSQGSVKQKGTKYASDFFPGTFWGIKIAWLVIVATAFSLQPYLKLNQLSTQRLMRGMIVAVLLYFGALIWLQKSVPVQRNISTWSSRRWASRKSGRRACNSYAKAAR